MTTPDKVLVAHNGALRRKYGTAGAKRVRAAADALIAADKRRGLRTRWAAIDDARTAKSLGVPKAAPGDAAAAKASVDAIQASWQPDYLVLLGAGDVIPFAALANPLFSPDPRRGDADREIPSDLPYACEQPYGTDPGAFRGPTRVVGRLPDVPGGTDPGVLERVLGIAAAYASRPRADFLPPFALTAADWRGSTAQSLTRLAGSLDGLAEVPAAAPPWPPEQSRRRLHFVNCHGGAGDWRYYGQRGRAYPLALDASDLALAQGTVAAAECCFGGMLFDPAQAGGHSSFVATYLAAGAYGYVAAANTAYGPANANDGADIVCRAFLSHVLEGASLGRALLQARQDYVFTKAALSPVDLKTLAQFTLYGDPAVQPVDTAPGGRAARRRRLTANGEGLHSTTTHAAARAVALAPAERARVTAALGAPADAVLASFPVVAAPAAAPGPAERFHVLQQRDERGLRITVAREESGRIERTATLLER